ncbi:MULTISPECIES: DNA polymerase Y family protein [unclassified Cryobacterium]|uniref:DNA polymerase Y family protein n=1 Tax=unclassified Cryobacterium TaxID=2649013 RepID=UPI00106B97EA|nr:MULTISPECIES: DNA polymerase Y family protein [unclassified Cryobacterium]TFC55691.1 DNA polymerase Y family protein [Cryobacterium sp. TMB3-1-2]TFC72753.1 DNA polymerase Y family protein [Cryobacterium sp. TMB3-15]TFC76259.1 DNA polymerase Y family protein [Cryobacterium sp. TMB3-10]TFD43474.1 DNA polymerase Y family protein [Cryobacterium sp. TMB3-12]
MNRERTIVLWCPDWPVLAARSATGLPADAPLALIDHGLVFACSPEARRLGVRRGLTVREAQFRCTDLVVLPYDPALDRRAFDPILDGLEDITPGVAVLRPGTCAIRARGPVRYYGSEAAAARAMLGYLHGAGLPEARVGIADGPFAAEQAARAVGPAGVGPEPRVHVVPPGESAAFLAPLPVSAVAEAGLGTLLARLGVHTLGQLAALPALDVHRRFGAAAAQAHARAAGREHEEVVPRTPTPVFDRGQEFEPALDRIDQLAFALRSTADAFVQGLREQTLVCTAVSILVSTEDGLLTERTWRHPRWFSASELIDRVRWQLQGEGRADSGLAAGVVRVVFSPDRVDAVANHEDGLWGTGPDERIHHALTRVQGLVGHAGVVTAAIGGGRMLADRQLSVPWGDDGAASSGRGLSSSPGGGPAGAARPWSGSLDGLLPATVYRERHPVALVADDGRSLRVDDRGAFDGEPARFSAPRFLEGAGGAQPSRVLAWAGPWPVRERWWDSAAARTVHRAQIVDERDGAWLLALDDDGWRAEARYD